MPENLLGEHFLDGQLSAQLQRVRVFPLELCGRSSSLVLVKGKLLHSTVMARISIMISVIALSWRCHRGRKTFCWSQNGAFALASGCPWFALTFEETFANNCQVAFGGLSDISNFCC